MNTIFETKTIMKHCLVKYFLKNLLHNSTYQNFTTFYTQNWLYSMFLAAHDLEKGRKEVEDRASIFISHQLRYHVEMLTNNVLDDDKITIIPKSVLL